MNVPQTQAAVAAATTTARALGLTVDDATVLHNSNRLAVRLLPCDVLVRVATDADPADAQRELDVAGRLAGAGSPVGGPDTRIEPRVYLEDGFATTFWTYYEPVAPLEIAPMEYARALEQLHAGMRTDMQPTQHFTARVAEAQRLVDDPALSPELVAADRELLSRTLREVPRTIARRGAAEQLLHGEPHPGNLLRTRNGLLFIDMQTCCRGPVEFDLAHAPDEVANDYRGADEGLLAECRILKLAMVAAWRWDKDDEFPGGREMGEDFVRQVREASR